MAALVGVEHELAYDMNKYLQDKRYLIVVDDFWRTSDWEIIEDAFPHNKCGSRILITTRIKSVARSCCSRNKDGLTEFGEISANKKTGGNDELVHELKPLGKVDSERLFSEAAFGISRTCPSKHSRQAYDEILRRCDGWGKLNNDDLEQICSSKFFLLKYLRIRNTGVSKLPPQIAELGYLETLDISYTQINELPLEVLELQELRVLDLRSTQVRLLSRYKPCLLPCLRHLLINGHTPDQTVTVVPEDIVDWGFLETLEAVDLSHCSPSFIKDLAKLRFLEVLAVTWSFHQCYSEEHQRALRSAIQRSVCLKSLAIHCEVGCSMEFLDLLPDAPQSPQHLRITARVHTVPKWIEGLNHLVFLDITVCKLALDGIKLLGSLERLESLALGLDFLQEEAILIGYEGFHQLRRLFINCRVPWLDFSEGAMSRLTDLDLIISTGPVGQESQLTGITNLLSLEQVTLSYDPWYINSQSVKEVVGAIWRQVGRGNNPCSSIRKVPRNEIIHKASSNGWIMIPLSCLEKEEEHCPGGNVVLALSFAQEKGMQHCPGTCQSHAVSNIS